MTNLEIGDGLAADDGHQSAPKVCRIFRRRLLLKIAAADVPEDDDEQGQKGGYNSITVWGGGTCLFGCPTTRDTVLKA